MPHAEIKYTNDLSLDTPTILAEIEKIIHTHDAGAGSCKGRAYPCAEFHHTHVLVAIFMLQKPHRDETFTTALMDELERTIKAHIPTSCYFSLELGYSDTNYVTNRHEP